MSVRKGDRGEGKLQVLNKARELKKYSLARLKNEKTFPKSTRWLYAAPIAAEVREACSGDTYHERKKMVSYYRELEETYGSQRI